MAAAIMSTPYTAITGIDQALAGVTVSLASRSIALAALTLGACSTDPGTEVVDGSSADATAQSVVDIPWLGEGEPPIAPPSLTPCPAGWREVASPTGPATCDPYPEVGAVECSAGDAHFPGEPDCAPVGSPCPVGDFSEVLPVDRTVVYVQPGASGDGSSASSPYGSLTAFSLAGLPMGTAVALSRGSHDGPVRLVRGVALRGACAAGTTLMTGVPSATDGVVTVFDATGELHDLTVAASPRVGMWVAGGSAAEAVLEGVVFADNQTSGVVVGGGARLSAQGLSIRGTRGRSSDGDLGRALSLELGATAQVTHAVFEANRELGVFAAGVGTLLVLDDAVLRDEGVSLPGVGGRGLGVQLGATAEVSRVLFERSRGTGLRANNAGSRLTLSDVVVRDTQGQASDGTLGIGLASREGASVQVTRVLLERSRALGVYVKDPGAEVTLADAVVRDTEGQSTDGEGGLGLGVELGADARVTRAVFERNRAAAVFANLTDAAVTLTDTRVRDTAAVEAGRFGRGLAVQSGATAELMRASFERNHDIGVYASEPGTALTLADVVVRDTQSQRSDGTFGRGLGVQDGAAVDVTRALFEANRDVSVSAHGAGAASTLSDVMVRDALVRDCAGTTCVGAGAGHGVGSYQQASLAMTRFILARAALCGAHVARDAELDLSEGEVRESAVGVCVQVEGYDVGRLTEGVRLDENGVNLQSTDLPVPEPAGAVATP